MKRIEFYKHNITQSDIHECEKVLYSLFLTTGAWVRSFEERFAQYLDIPYAVGLTSCTEALFLALKYFGVKEGDEVITTPLSFIATANAIEHCGAKPVFIDVEHSTGNVNHSLIEKAITRRTKAIIPVHLYGQMCDMKAIRKIANRHNLKIIEDCAHCIEGKRDGIRAGQLGDVACFSFYATKNMTSGEGGTIACNDKAIYEWFVRARQHGMSKSASERYTKRYEHYDMEFLGYKCGMSNIQAALLLHQIDRIENYRKKKERIAGMYDNVFKKNKHIGLFSTLPGAIHARHAYTILVTPKKRDTYLHALQEKGIGVAVNFRPIHLMKYYRKKYGYAQGQYPVAERIGTSTITLPFYPKLTKKQIRYVIDTVNTVIVD